MQDLDDLLRKLRQKPDDRQTWNQLIRSLYPVVVTYLYKRTSGNSALSKDLTQETFLRLIQQFKNGAFESTGPVSIKYYCFRTATNLLIDHSRKDQWMVFDDEKLNFPVNTHSPEELLAEIDNFTKIEKKLTPENQSLLDLVVMGYSIQEIASKLNTSYAAAGNRVSRLRKELRKLLKDAI